ncbi:hypothetical protein [Nocardia sp. NPDC046763]|uniref:hypothetical protein n=1 Tax=Nocardia sp. NPDC046763 TaxID=3155256 RepID=UPI00340EB3B7
MPALAEALTGRFTAHHGYLVGMNLNLVDAATAAIADLDARIAQALGPTLTAAVEGSQ